MRAGANNGPINHTMTIAAHHLSFMYRSVARSSVLKRRFLRALIVSVEPVGGASFRGDLAVPTAPLFWAGEATSTDGGAECVHGALTTGRRAAVEALHLLRPASVSDPASRLEWARYRD